MIKIMADSTCDLSHQVLDQYNISLAPLTIKIEGNVYRDRVEIKPDEFYEMVESLQEFPTTGAPSPSEYAEIMKEAVAEGYTEILCICMSSGTSGSYQSAELAKDYFYEEMPDSPVRIHVVDSKCMSHGSGWLLMKSALMRERGAPFDEIVEFTEAYKTRVKHFLSVDDLNHLIKSGRISNASAIIGKFLLLKPIMTMKNGTGTVVAKERGRKRVLKHYVQQFIKRNDPEVTEFIIIGYTSDRTVAETLKEKVREETNFTGDIHVMQMGVAVGTHVGLGAISMFFVEKSRE
ncbi:DegV family protein [Jeotgalibacillus sp. S-D1]|uniref:DegV family protein n=1 Tax=Jeotgalibacillus sp. S-D1 TaxID=2552189 RepID=UPI001059C4CE|nr:DegV family protein [Jeotgalibacillus sp. S-D1]TDL31965.1 DegV family protein [Jeotgalibacillus sp. S-D1]